jgi:DNA-3-methyladenine glycosylase I
MKEIERCSWPGTDPLYVEYHDEEWGVPELDARALYEKLILDGFQAGLSWITILRKRDNFRKAFDGFDPEKIARYSDKKVERLLKDEGIIRHRGKIEGAIKNAREFLKIEDNEPGGFSYFIWKFVDGKPMQNALRSVKEAQAETDMSRALSKELRKRGFTFVGPTIVYAFAQAVGMVNDHTIACFRHKECAAMAKTVKFSSKIEPK